MQGRASLTNRIAVDSLGSAGQTLTDYRDTDHKGFNIRVRAGGARRWFYRCRIANKVYRYWIGPYPKITCAEAFKQYEDLEDLVKHGINPVLDEQAARDLEAKKQSAADARLTLTALFDDHYMPKYAKIRKRSWALDEFLFNRHVKKQVGKEKAEDFNRQSITAIVKALEDGGKVTTARQVLALIRKVYNWANSDGVELIDCKNPATYKMQSKAKADDLILSEDEIKILWPALGDSNADRAIGLLLLIGCRPAEVARMHRSEIDSTAREWVLPAARMKNKRPHVVPLSDAMLALIQDKQGFIFATYGRHGAMHPITINLTGWPIRVLSRSGEWRRAERNLPVS